MLKFMCEVSMNILENTRFLMKKYNISASKALGQNFLIDEEVISKTIDTAKIRKRGFGN